jgi:hypothetical protein
LKMNRGFDGPSRSPFSRNRVKGVLHFTPVHPSSFLFFLFLEIFQTVFSKVRRTSGNRFSMGDWPGCSAPADEHGIDSPQAQATTVFQSGNPCRAKGLFYKSNEKSPLSTDPDNFLRGRSNTAWNRHSLRALNFPADKGNRTFLSDFSPAIPRPQVVSLPRPPPFEAEFMKPPLGFEN